jgi:lipid-A-disaccharide synthase
MNLLILTGEVSGDLYGATLARFLKQAHSHLTIEALGGEALKAVADRFLLETAYGHAVGIAGIFQSAFRIQALKKTLKEAYQRSPWDAVILVDFQHYNFKLAPFFQALNVPIFTFITPNFWIWGSVSGAKKVAAYSHSIFTIFEKEYALYRDLHPRVYYLGHPLVDVVAQDVNSMTRKPVKGLWDLALMPGSRMQEIEMLLPKMMQTALLLKQRLPHLKVHLAVSTPRFLPQIEAILAQYPEVSVQQWQDQKKDLFAVSDFMICASGSVTLEAILYRVPIGVFCALPALTYWIAYWILGLRKKMPWISLPNIIGDKEIAPEWVQSDIDPPRVAKDILSRFENDPEAGWVLGYQEVIHSMKPGESPMEAVACKLITLIQAT